MKRYRVEIGQEARDQLAMIQRYIAEHATPYIATAYVDAMLTKIAGLKALARQAARKSRNGSSDVSSEVKSSCFDA